MERLQKVLAHAGVASRRKCEELIVNGQVEVNGELVTDLGRKVNVEIDDIVVQGKPIIREQLSYYLLHKPTGYITSVTDPHGRKVVMELMQDIRERVYPVGRLDQDTSGLLIFTNDGDLAYKLMHPSFELDKVYLATVKGIPTPESLEQLEKGVLLDDGWTAPAKVELISTNAIRNRASIRLTIHEGRNRQVRRMCKKVGHAVISLHREKFGSLDLEGLAVGHYRKLTEEEVKELKRLVT